MLKPNRKDVQKYRTRGKGNQSKNKSGNKRGQGPRNMTLQEVLKVPVEWNSIHGETFINERNKFKAFHIGHFDATHVKSETCKSKRQRVVKVVKQE